MAVQAEKLPREMMNEIFGYLDIQAPSFARLQHQPAPDLTDSRTVNLKSVSAVSWRWRQNVLGLLFKHVRVQLEWDAESYWTSNIEAMLKFVKRGEMAPTIQSLTIIFNSFKENRHLSKEKPPPGMIDHLWKSIFDIISPQRLTVVAPPAILSCMTSCSLSAPVLAHYHIPHQILSLALAPSSEPAQISKAKPSLLSIRPWSSLLLNEGSFIRAYSICGYPYIGTIPPSILKDLVGGSRKTNKFILPSSIQDFSYVAIFPFSFHFDNLRNLPPQLRRLFVKFMPSGDVLADPWQTAQANVLDMVQERNNCYEQLLNIVSKPEEAKLHRHLNMIECGDGATDPAWGAEVARHHDAIANINSGIIIR
ncbi:hypothetical protein MMC34_005452 [Xylographa carneopallida]|nr:hypothetical protein [Xylographa carneopallida]